MVRVAVREPHPLVRLVHSRTVTKVDSIGFEEVQEIWEHPYYEDYRSDDPEQFRAIGWVN